MGLPLINKFLSNLVLNVIILNLIYMSINNCNGHMFLHFISIFPLFFQVCYLIQTYVRQKISFLYHDTHHIMVGTLGRRTHVVSREMSSSHDSSSKATESNDNGIAISMLKLAIACSHMLEQSAKKPSSAGQLLSCYPLLKVGFMDCRI